VPIREALLRRPVPAPVRAIGLGAIPLAPHAERTDAGGGHPYGDRFDDIAGSAYLAGGFGMRALTSNDVVVVPIRSVPRLLAPAIQTLAGDKI